jgi:ppGpp synthetase/RelA/SpoT-type nucleotidyltranferase
MIALFHKTLELDPATYFIGGRPLKTVEAITAKLVRGKTRLHKMQDIAGTRIVVPTLEAQEIVMGIVLAMFGAREGVVAKDTREKGDQWGYRAVHIVARLDGRLAEVQVRTKNQDSWAQVVESIDRSHRWDLKHGIGPTDWIEWLITLSDALRERDLGRPAPLPLDPYERLLENEKEGGSTE